jgi:hypothetical protein
MARGMKLDPCVKVCWWVRLLMKLSDLRLAAVFPLCTVGPQLLADASTRQQPMLEVEFSNPAAFSVS